MDNIKKIIRRFISIIALFLGLPIALFPQVDQLKDISEGFSGRNNNTLIYVTVVFVLFVFITILLLLTRGFASIAKKTKEELKQQTIKYKKLIVKLKFSTNQIKLIDDIITTCNIKKPANFLIDRKTFNTVISYYIRNVLVEKTQKLEEQCNSIEGIRKILEFNKAKPNTVYTTTKELPLKMPITIINHGKSKNGGIYINKENALHIAFKESVKSLFPPNTKIIAKHYNPVMGHYRFILYTQENLSGGYELMVAHNNKLPKPIKRKHQRLDLQQEVDFYLEGSQQKENALLLDISIGGALIKTQYNIKLGTQIVLYATLLQRFNFYQANSTIIRKKKNIDNSFEYNLRFNNINHIQQRAIIQTLQLAKKR